MEVKKSLANKILSHFVPPIEEEQLSHRMDKYLDMSKKEASRTRWNKYYKKQGIEYEDRINLGLQKFEHSDVESSDSHEALDYLKKKESEQKLLVDEKGQEMTGLSDFTKQKSKEHKDQAMIEGVSIKSLKKKSRSKKHESGAETPSMKARKNKPVKGVSMPHLKV